MKLEQAAAVVCRTVWLTRIVSCLGEYLGRERGLIVGKGWSRPNCLLHAVNIKRKQAHIILFHTLENMSSIGQLLVALIGHSCPFFAASLLHFRSRDYISLCRQARLVLLICMFVTAAYISATFLLYFCYISRLHFRSRDEQASGHVTCNGRLQQKLSIISGEIMMEKLRVMFYEKITQCACSFISWSSVRQMQRAKCTHSKESKSACAVGQNEQRSANIRCVCTLEPGNHTWHLASS